MARSEESVAGVREQIEGSGGKALPVTADATDAGSVASAETYWRLHTQNPTAWTLELDLRPSVERF